MINPIESHNTKVAGSPRAFWLPSGLEVFIYLFVSLLGLVALNFKPLWDYLNNSILATGTGLGSVLEQRLDWLPSWLGANTETRIVQSLFWLVIGCCVYVFIWFVGSTITNIRNDIVAAEYVHPASYQKTGYWTSVLSRKIFLVGALVTLIAFIFACFKLLPELAALARQAVRHFSWLSSSLKLLAALLATTLVLYLLIFLGRLIIHSWQAIYNDL